jgi:hypothetical protein
MQNAANRLMDALGLYGEQALGRSLHVPRCPHCSVANPHLPVVHSQPESAASQVEKPGIWSAFRCSSCGGLVLAHAPNKSSYGSQQPGNIDQIIPRPSEANAAIPSIARTFLQQAMNTLHAPDAAALMAGSAVDAMLKHLKFEEGSVYKRIEQAAEGGILTRNMADWAHSVRLGANRPRHADKDKPHVNFEEAKRSVEFAEALGDFLFVLSAKIETAIGATKDDAPAEKPTS